MQRFSIRLLTAILLGGLAASTVRAAVIDFTYAATPTVTAASASPAGTTDTITNGITIGGLPAATFTSVAVSGTTSITLTGRNPSGSQDAQNGDNTPFLDVTVTTNDVATRNFSVNFDTSYTITDPTPNGGPGPQTIHFTGKLTGFVDGQSSAATNLSFSNVDFSPAIGTGPTVTAGNGTFHVILKDFNDPGIRASLGRPCLRVRHRSRARAGNRGASDDRRPDLACRATSAFWPAS